MEEESVVVEVGHREFEVFLKTESDIAEDESCPICGHAQVRDKYVVEQIFDGDLEIAEEDAPELYGEIVVEVLEQLGDARATCGNCEDQERGDLHEDDFC